MLYVVELVEYADVSVAGAREETGVLCAVCHARDVELSLLTNKKKESQDTKKLLFISGS